MTNTYTVMTTAYYQDMMVTSSAQGQKGKKPLPERSFPNFRDCVKSEAHGHSLNMSGLDDLSIRLCTDPQYLFNLLDVVTVRPA